MGNSTGVTLKSFIIGSILTLLLSIFEPYFVLVYNAKGFTFDFITAGAIVFFFIFVGLINVLLGLLNKKYALNSAELVIVYIMLVIGATIPSMGLVLHLIPLISGLFYFGTSANQWVDKIIPHIPNWLIPHDPQVHKYLYEGLPDGAHIPWGAWFVPLLAWIALMVVLCAVSLAIMVILRKQWVVNERLVFPLTAVPLEMIREDEGKESFIKPLFRNKLMWVGFAVAFLFMSWNGIAKFFPFLAPITLYKWYLVLRNTTAIGLTFSFVIIGFTYFVNIDVAFSFWFFHLLSKLLTGVFSITGFGLKGAMAPYEEGQLPSITQVGMGSLIVLVLYGLWTSKNHLRNVFRKIFNSKYDFDDSDEIMSYRTSFVIIVFGLVFIFGWLKLTGLSLLVSPYFVFILFIIFIGMSRIMAEGGFGFGKPASMPMSYLTHTVPTNMLGDTGMTSMALSTPYAGDVRTLFMTSAANSLKMLGRDNNGTKYVALVMLSAVVISLLGSLITTLNVAYTYGGTSLQVGVGGGTGWFFTGYPNMVWGYVISKLNNPTDVAAVLDRWVWAGAGGAIMFVLMYMHHTFLWWPIHYVGFPIVASNLFTHSWLCIFIGWLIKLIVLKYGSISLYRKLKPLFIGLILGQLCCALFWLGVCYFANIRTGIDVLVGLP